MGWEGVGNGNCSIREGIGWEMAVWHGRSRVFPVSVYIRADNECSVGCKGNGGDHT